MSKYANRAIMSLLNMCNEMFRKNIEIRRITKTCTLLLMSGLSPNDIPRKIVDKCLSYFCNYFYQSGFQTCEVITFFRFCFDCFLCYSLTFFVGEFSF